MTARHRKPATACQRGTARSSRFRLSQQCTYKGLLHCQLRATRCIPPHLLLMSAPLGTDLRLTVGVLEVSVALAFFHTGITLIQAGTYFRAGNCDPQGMRGLVAFATCADILHTALLMHALYHYTIISFADYEAIGHMIWSFPASVLVIGVVTMFGLRTYWCVKRVYNLTSSTAVAVTCWAPVVAAAAVEFSLAGSQLRDLSWQLAYTRSFKVRLGVTFGLSALADTLIAATICRSLYKMRSGFAKSDKLIDKLMAFAVGSGLLTSVASLIALLVYLFAKPSFIFAAFYILMPKIITNSFLVSLNERTHNRQELMQMSPMIVSSARVHIIITIA
ncbi:hypothetical protein EXIGLDRAFT_184854 [Exidia glandulosa HHB12029]|uniref:DUF6534 domain-containing protein n=1 Tax=Exidia glandulosa HHB12029 TaxID=1314781 RepID=A0A165F111_EXIGL|nr:hypothetical protein EXIGLDRAFT_184854 [Exidia glandulosa HHB12029]